jgi:hypothetical protein
MKFLYVKNWDEFQHYKDRSPPWIKLHRDLLRDYNFLCLQDASKLHLMLIWLLASQMDNKIPADEKFIRNQIGVKEKIDFNELIEKGFLIDASNALAKCKQTAIGETETETETETDIRARKNHSTGKSLKNYFGGEDFDIPQDWGDMAYEDGLDAEEINWHFTKFKNYWLSAGGAKATKKNWKRTWQNWYMNELERKKRKEELNVIYTKKS